MPLNDIAANQLTTKAFIKALWGITGITDDVLIDNLINAVSTRIETETNRKFVKQSYTSEKYDIATRTPILVLNQYPIDTTATFTVVEDTTTLVKDTDYKIYDKQGYIRRVGKIFGEVSDWNTWRGGLQIIAVTYTAGFSPVPYDLELAVAKWVIQQYEAFTKRMLVITNASIGDGSTVQMTLDEIPHDVWKVIKLYERMLT